MVWIRRRKPWDFDLGDIFDYIDFQVWRAFESFRKRIEDLTPVRWGFGMGYELIDEGDKYVIEMELPGVNKEDIEINVRDHVLEIIVRKKEELEKEKEGYYISRKYYSGFKEIITLPADADTEKIRARYRNGILRIEIEKKISKGKKINLE